MLEDTDTLRVPPLPIILQSQRAAEREPGNLLLGAGIALIAVAATFLFVWVADPRLTSAQRALITFVGLVVGGATTLSCHFGRRWIREAKKAIITSLETTAKQARAQRLDVSNDVSTVSAELEGLKALWVDFIKSYPPLDTDDRLYRLAERVEALTCAVEGLPPGLPVTDLATERRLAAMREEFDDKLAAAVVEAVRVIQCGTGASVLPMQRRITDR